MNKKTRKDVRNLMMELMKENREFRLSKNVDPDKFRLLRYIFCNYIYDNEYYEELSKISDAEHGNTQRRNPVFKDIIIHSDFLDKVLIPSLEYLVELDDDEIAAFSSLFASLTLTSSQEI